MSKFLISLHEHSNKGQQILRDIIYALPPAYRGGHTVDAMLSMIRGGQHEIQLPEDKEAESRAIKKILDLRDVKIVRVE